MVLKMPELLYLKNHILKFADDSYLDSFQSVMSFSCHSFYGSRSPATFVTVVRFRLRPTWSLALRFEGEMPLAAVQWLTKILACTRFPDLPDIWYWVHNQYSVNSISVQGALLIFFDISKYSKFTIYTCMLTEKFRKNLASLGLVSMQIKSNPKIHQQKIIFNIIFLTNLYKFWNYTNSIILMNEILLIKTSIQCLFPNPNWLV